MTDSRSMQCVTGWIDSTRRLYEVPYSLCDSDGAVCIPVNLYYD